MEYIDKCENKLDCSCKQHINDYLSIFTICESNSIWCCIDRVIDWRRWDFLLSIGIIALILGLKGKDTGVMFTSIAAGTLTIIEVINFSNAINEEEFGYLMQKESGYYLMIAATIVLVIAGLYRKFMPDAN